MKRKLGAFLFLVVLGGWPSTALRKATSDLLSPILSSMLASCEFGQGGRAMVRSAEIADVRRPGENVTTDAQLRLTIDGLRNESINAINLRRDFYLPLWIALLAASLAPADWTQRVWALALTLPTVFALCFGALYLTICWIFAHQAPVIYPLEPGMLRSLDALVGALLMPPSLRFFVPLLVALVAVLLAKTLSSGARAAKPGHPLPPATPPTRP